jgi:hypothetical protein
MDTVRIGFFLGELYELSVWACNIGNTFLYWKVKEKVFTNTGSECGGILHGKILMIDKSLYVIKTSVIRFHELKVNHL